ncbi:MAG: plasmid mobilization relaxosome protein MobC [Ruminococcus sp.]|nr:plasmid mobilization relaxosome protein MobC [Ruminococcus sp.]
MQIRLTEAEYEAIERKFRNSGLKSRSEFIRTMIFEGYLILINKDELKKLNQLIYNVANNINQIAVRVNSTGNVYADDISEIKEGQDKIWQQLKFFQSKFLSLTH